MKPGSFSTAAANQADKDGFYPFSANPQEENPARGYIVSANFQPLSPTGMEIPGYYNLADRGQQLNRQLSDKSVKWDHRRQPEAATGHRHRLRPALAGAVAAGAA